MPGNVGTSIIKSSFNTKVNSKTTTLLEDINLGIEIFNRSEILQGINVPQLKQKLLAGLSNANSPLKYEKIKLTMANYQSEFNKIKDKFQTGQNDKTDTYLDLLATYHCLKILVVICVYSRLHELQADSNLKQETEKLTSGLSEVSSQLDSVLRLIEKEQSQTSSNSSIDVIKEKIKKIQEYIDKVSPILEVSMQTLANFSTVSADMIEPTQNA